MPWIIWIVAAIVLIVLEIFTPSLFFFTCLAIGSFFAAIAAYFTTSFWAEIAVFTAATVLSIFFIRPLLRRYLKTTDSKSSNIDELIGHDAVVTEKIAPNQTGFIKVMGEIWVAQSDEEIEKDAVVTVLSVMGTKLKVKKK